MRDWNVVVSVQGEGFSLARKALRPLGRVEPTAYYNVLVMKVADPATFLEEFEVLAANLPELGLVVSRVMPAAVTFDFATPEEFESKAGDAVLTWRRNLAGKSFHVRFHRRGFKGALPSQTEEQLLDGALLEALEADGAPGRITFDDPDAIIAVETVDGRAGLALWTQEDLSRHPVLKLD